MSTRAHQPPPDAGRPALVLARARFLATPPDAESDSDALAPWVNPAEIAHDYAARKALVAKIKSEALHAIRFRAAVFGDRPNLNRTRPEPGRLGDLAKSALWKPYQHGHGGWFWDSDQAGSIIRAEVIKDADGVPELVLDHEITNPEEMIAFVNNTRRQFSISLRAEEWVCSECGEPCDFGWFGPEFDCKHDFDDAELYGTGRLTFLHNAAVSDPAYEDARILDAYRAANRASEPDKIVLFGLRPLNYSQGAAVATKPDQGAAPAPATPPAAPDPTPPPPPASQHSAPADDVAALRAELERERKARADAETSLFEAAWTRAVSRHAVAPAERADFDQIRSAMGATFAVAALDKRAPLAGYPSQATGHDGAGEGTSRHSADGADDDALVRQAVAFHLIKPDLAKRVASGTWRVPPLGDSRGRS